jgi:hypothetical protein
LAIVLLFGLSTAAHAEFYLGASYLSTDADLGNAVESFSTDDSGYKFFGGFTFLKFLGVEASYRDMGNHTETKELTSSDVDLRSVDLAARGILPIGKRLELFAKLGYAHIEYDGAFDINGVVDPVDETSDELMYGLGVGFKFGGFFGLRAEWETYEVDTSLNSFSLGAVFRF